MNKEVWLSGAERYADYYLTGQDGWRESEKDGRGREMPQHRSFEMRSKDGLNVGEHRSESSGFGGKFHLWLMIIP